MIGEKKTENICAFIQKIEEIRLIKELKIQEQNEDYQQQLKEYNEQKEKTKRCKEPQKPKEIKRGRPREKEIIPEIIIDRTVRFNLILDIEDVF